MRITPLDVRKQEFRKAMRGLDPDEVHAFLATVADEYEAVLNDNKALRERVLELDDKVNEYRGMEKTLRDTLLTAERVTVDAKDNARREANLIIKEAQIEAEKALRDIKGEAMKLRQEIQQLRSQREAYLAKMRVVAQSHLQFVESAASDFHDEDERLDDPMRERKRSMREDGSDARQARALFDTPPERARRERPSAASARPTGPTERPATPPPVAPTPPDRPVATAAPPAEPPRSGESPGRERARGDSKPLADLSAILERMAEGQREVLQADHVLVEDAPNDFAPLGDADAAPTRRAGAGRGRAGGKGAEPLKGRERKGAREGDADGGNEVTGEWSLEQIRRNIMASYDDENER